MSSHWSFQWCGYCLKLRHAKVIAVEVACPAREISTGICLTNHYIKCHAKTEKIICIALYVWWIVKQLFEQQLCHKRSNMGIRCTVFNCIISWCTARMSTHEIVANRQITRYIWILNREPTNQTTTQSTVHPSNQPQELTLSHDLFYRVFFYKLATQRTSGVLSVIVDVVMHLSSEPRGVVSLLIKEAPGDLKHQYVH